ncbi:lysosomal acid phosphatase-like isoform X2 [Sipha flava]|nr:lysosomal acid phosphatase-like isoform X2 [Sipha flava]
MDPYANKSYWPMGFGQLTLTGIEEHYELGVWLRKRYSGWLPEVYSTEDIYIRSSDYDRTIMSAEANLDGLYPPVEPKKWNQLIPIHTVPKLQDNVLAMSEACPLYSQELEKIQNDEDVQSFYAQFSSVIKYIFNNAGATMEEKSKPIYFITTVFQALTIESKFNYTLPDWTKRIFPEPLTTIAIKNYELSTHNNIMKRLKCGPLLKDIVTHMNEKKHGSLNPNRKLWIYSGHDTTIYSLLNTMGINNNLLVPYAAVLMIELRLNNTGNYVVTVSYRNTSIHDPYLLQVPGCDSVACDLDQLTEVLIPFIPNDWDTECKINVKNNTSELLIFFLGVISAIVIILILYAIANKRILHYGKRSYYYTF